MGWGEEGGELELLSHWYLAKHQAYGGERWEKGREQGFTVYTTMMDYFG